MKAKAQPGSPKKRNGREQKSPGGVRGIAPSIYYHSEGTALSPRFPNFHSMARPATGRGNKEVCLMRGMSGKRRDNEDACAAAHPPPCGEGRRAIAAQRRLQDGVGVPRLVSNVSGAERARPGFL